MTRCRDAALARVWDGPTDDALRYVADHNPYRAALHPDMSEQPARGDGDEGDE